MSLEHKQEFLACYKKQVHESFIFHFEDKMLTYSTVNPMRDSWKKVAEQF